MGSKISNKIIDGYDLPTIGGAINKIRISEGLRTDELAQYSGVDRTVLDCLYAGKYTNNDHLIRIIQALDESTPRDFDLSTVEKIVTHAKEIPEITHATLQKAFTRTLCEQSMSRATFEKKTRELHPTRFRNGESIASAEFERDYYRAKVLGFRSLGALLLHDMQVHGAQADNWVDAVHSATAQSRGGI